MGKFFKFTFLLLFVSCSTSTSQLFSWKLTESEESTIFLKLARTPSSETQTPESVIVEDSPFLALTQFSDEVANICGFGKAAGPLGREYARNYYDPSVSVEFRVKRCDRWNQLKSDFANSLKAKTHLNPDMKNLGNTAFFLPVEKFLASSRLSVDDPLLSLHTFYKHMERVPARDAQKNEVSSCKRVLDYVDTLCGQQLRAQELCTEDFAKAITIDLVEEIRNKNSSMLMDARQAFPAADMRSEGNYYGSGVQIEPKSEAKLWLENFYQNIYLRAYSFERPFLKSSSLKSASSGYSAQYFFSDGTALHYVFSPKMEGASYLKVKDRNSVNYECKLDGNFAFQRAVQMSFDRQSLFPAWNEEGCKELSSQTLIGKTLSQLKQVYPSIIQSSCGPSSEQSGKSQDCFRIQLNTQDWINVKLTTFEGSVSRVTRVEFFRQNYDIEMLNQELLSYGFKATLITPQVSQITAQKRAQLVSVKQMLSCPIFASVGMQGKIIITYGGTEGGPATGSSVAPVTIPDDKSDIKMFRDPPKK